MHARIAWLLTALCVGCGRGALPVFTHDQTASTHPGYRRSMITSGAAVYVNDFEEYALRLANSDPTNVVGRSKFGNGTICAIPGQSTNAYLSADVGSEMPAYAVFRNIKQPVFDWRPVKFQSLRLDVLLGPAANKLTTDPAVIEDVLATLRAGGPASPQPVVVSDAHSLSLVSDQLPGLVFCPALYIDATGQVFLSESCAVEFTNRTQILHARWIPASAAFTRWTQTKD